MTKVKIDTPGVTVEIESDLSLDQVAKEALDLFNSAGGWPQPRSASAVGFSGDRPPSEPVAPSSMPGHPFPYRIQQ